MAAVAFEIILPEEKAVVGLLHPGIRGVSIHACRASWRMMHERTLCVHRVAHGSAIRMVPTFLHMRAIVT